MDVAHTMRDVKRNLLGTLIMDSHIQILRIQFDRFSQ